MAGRAAAVRDAACLDERRPFCCSGSGTSRGGGYTRLCRATDQGAALPRHGSGRGSAAPRSVARQALPRQRLATPVTATSALYRVTM